MPLKTPLAPNPTPLPSSSTPTLVLHFRTLPSANSATRVTRTGHVYTNKDIVLAKDNAKYAVAAQVLAAKWQIAPDDWYSVDYLFGVSSLLREDADNIEKTTNDCLQRSYDRRKKNKKTGYYDIVHVCGGNAIWDDKRIIAKHIRKAEDVPLDAEGYPVTMLFIQKIADPRQPKPKIVSRRKKKEQPDDDTNTVKRHRNVNYPAH